MNSEESHAVRTIIPSHLKPSETGPDENGIYTIVEYALNDRDQIIKITRQVKRTVQQVRVPRAVYERRKWTKFGDCQDVGHGPEKGITIPLGPMILNLDAVKKPEVLEGRVEMPTITCKNCGESGHFSVKCPRRKDIPDEYAELPVKGGKYVPPGMRQQGGTLKVSNISEDIDDRDIRYLFSNFGDIEKVTVPKNYPHDWNNQRGNYKLLKNRGFAFVNFVRHADGEAARKVLHGSKYENMILTVEWTES